MSKFASTSSLLLSIALIVVGALAPRVEFLSFLSGFSHIFYIAGIVLFAIFLIAAVGFKRFFVILLALIIFVALEFAVSLMFALFGLGGLIFEFIAFVIEIFIIVPIIGKLL